MQLVLFKTSVGPYEELPFRASVDLRAMVMKECFPFPKVPASLEPQHKIV